MGLNRKPALPGLELQLNQIELDIDAVESSVSTLQGQVSTTNSTLATQQSDINSLKDSKTSMVASIAENAADIATLETSKIDTTFVKSGVFQPNVNSATSYSVRNGDYYLIGNLVICRISVTVEAFSDTSSTTQLSIANLPYVCSDSVGVGQVSLSITGVDPSLKIQGHSYINKGAGSFPVLKINASGYADTLKMSDLKPSFTVNALCIYEREVS